VAEVSTGQRIRIVHFSVQHNHVHLIAEAPDELTLSRGAQGLAIRLAKAANKTLRRSGTFWADRYHARALKTPREVRNALVYVLQNRKKHGGLPGLVDPLSSAPWFGGWRDPELAAGVLERALDDCPVSPVGPSRTWLLNKGWRRRGLISVREAPARPKNPSTANQRRV
jgi:hypothetical protein